MQYKKKVFLMGGIGNKLFQLARALEFSKKNLEVELVFVGNNLLFFYKFSRHSVHGDWLDISKLAEQMGIRVRQASLLEFFSLAIRFFGRRLGLQVTFNLSLDQALPEAQPRSQSDWDIGYFQSKSHVSEETLTLVATSLASFLGITPSQQFDQITCHLRGGDFDIKNRVQASYIENLHYLCRSNSLKLVVVTNDDAFCQQTLKSQPYELYKGISTIEDFKKLACANQLYLSNSTFAFWSALLAVRSHNAVIHVPDDWAYSDFLK